LLAIVLLFVAFPFYWMINTSFKSVLEANRIPPTVIPMEPTLDAYKFLLDNWDYGQVLANTLIVAGSSALGATVLGGMAAYAISRLDFPGSGLCYGFMVATMALPGMVVIGPLFIAYRDLGLLNTRLGIALAFLSGGLPFAVLVIFSALNSIPKALDDAAAIDGCSWFDTLFRVIVPIALPAFVVSFLLLFIWAWNEFLLPFVLTITPENTVLTVQLFEMPFRGDVRLPQVDIIAAGSFLVLLPIIPILILGQRRLVEGILAGAMSGE
jgi:ABC-type glycerol-3-phosphate transport system permease component